MFCPECSAPNEDDAIFCGNCGAVLKPEEMPVEAIADVSPLEPEARAEIEEIQPAAAEVLPAPAVKQSEPWAAARAPVPAGSTLPTNGMAIASLVLGIGGLTILPLLGSIVAIILGTMARKEIRQRPTEISGEGLATAGIVLGWITVGLSVLGLVLGVGFMVCGLCGSLGSGSW